jgi:hypothetical protein
MRASGATIPQKGNTIPATRSKPQWKNTVPAAPDVAARVCDRLERGHLWSAISQDEGITYAAMLAAAEQDEAIRSRFMEAREARQAGWRVAVEDTGAIMLATARAELAETEEDGDNKDGPYTKRIKRRSAAAAQAGAALLMPAIHGKGAGRAAPVTVHANNAAFFGGAAPAGTLDDWTPAGLGE